MVIYRLSKVVSTQNTMIDEVFKFPGIEGVPTELLRLTHGTSDNPLPIPWDETIVTEIVIDNVALMADIEDGKIDEFSGIAHQDGNVCLRPRANQVTY